MEVLPVPKTSHAKPRRGATRTAFVGTRPRFGPSCPPAIPNSAQGLSAVGKSRPLHGLLPSARFTEFGSKLDIRSSTAYGQVKWVRRTPISALTREFTL